MVWPAGLRHYTRNCEVTGSSPSLESSLLLPLLNLSVVQHKRLKIPSFMCCWTVHVNKDLMVEGKYRPRKILQKFPSTLENTRGVWVVQLSFLAFLWGSSQTFLTTNSKRDDEISSKTCINPNHTPVQPHPAPVPLHTSQNNPPMPMLNSTGSKRTESTTFNIPNIAVTL